MKKELLKVNIQHKNDIYGFRGKEMFEHLDMNKVKNRVTDPGIFRGSDPNPFFFLKVGSGSWSTPARSAFMP